jgi:tRNA (mo5U34)-methyltransferase
MVDTPPSDQHESFELTDAVLREQIAQVRWFHAIELRPGLITPAPEPTSERVDLLRMPVDLSGKSVLDIGAWDGFFSFEAERRGASRVVAADYFAWHGENWSDKSGFELARRALGSKVEDVDIDVMDLAPDRTGTFDLVLFLGVLYHLRHPLLALERVASVTGEQLILETHVDLTWLRRPAMAFYHDKELRWDPTNWWGPNPAAVAGMLLAVGFKRVELVTPNSVVYRAARTAKRAGRYVNHLARYRAKPPERIDQGRAVFHAFK